MKITDKTTPTGGMTEERARDLLETPGTVFKWRTTTFIVDEEGGAVSLANGRRYSDTARWIEGALLAKRDGNLHFRSAELILRDFVEGEG